MKPVLGLVILALVALPHAATAEPAPAAAADASGRAHFQRGQRLSAAGDHAAAYREYAAGYALTERPLFLFNMGESARASGDNAKAREAYLAFLRVDPDNALANTARQRIYDLDRASPVVAPPPPPAPPPSVVVTTPPPAPIARAPEGQPIYKKWPFWAVVVGGAVAGGAIVFAVTRPGDACGARCTELDFR